MFIEKVITGKFVELRSANIEDADFTLGIRQDPELTKYLPVVHNTIEQQRKWIMLQREKAGDYFFVVSDKFGKDIGTVSVYNIKKNEANLGRLASRGSFLQKIEASILALDFLFNDLGLQFALDDTYEENQNTIRFNEGFGWIHDEAVENEYGIRVCYGRLSKEDYLKNRKKFSKMLYR